MGGYLPAVTAAGAARESGPGFVASLAERVAPGIGRNALGVGIGLGTAGGGLQVLPWALSNPLTAAQMLGLAGLGYAGKQALGRRYSAPAYTQQVIENTLRPKGEPIFMNPLLPFIPTLSSRNP